jgi:hypothetical protein
MDPLRLIALDGDDIEVVSAHLQDAVVKAADIHWRPSDRGVVVGLNRFDWAAGGAATPEFRRRRAALRFERVSSCKCRNVASPDKDKVLNLLAVSFEATDGPSGVVVLTFSGGAALRLDVECLEAELADLGPIWVTECCPAHIVEDVAEGTVAARVGTAKQG